MGLVLTKVGGAAYASDGIQQISLSVDGSVIATLSYPDEPTETTWEASWTPQNAGKHTLIATVTSANGSSNAFEVTVVVATPTPTPTPVPTPTNTPTPTPTTIPTTSSTTIYLPLINR
jgi:hypothetical protein